MDTLNTTTDGAVLIVEMNRPDALNALNAAMIDDLAETFLEAATDDAVKVLLLTGAGRAFSAGADLAEMGTDLPEPRHGLQAMIDAIICFPKPFIVAINGVGAGYGATVAGLADLTFIAEGARLRCPFSALGLVPELASSHTFQRLMGRQRATWFLMSSQWVGAAECVEAGLAFKCCPDDELMDTAMGHARTLAALPLSSLVATKELIVGPQLDQMLAASRTENAGLDRMFGSPANREAVSAFRERREPDFTGM